jgi:carbon-monoxide dehydrogenase large subunit
MDVVARELNMDPVEVRRKNFPAASEFPFHTATGLDYDSGDYEAALNKALDLSGYQKLVTNRRSRVTTEN